MTKLPSVATRGRLRIPFACRVTLVLAAAGCAELTAIGSSAQCGNHVLDEGESTGAPNDRSSAR